jgi:hypothetical protein
MRSHLITLLTVGFLSVSTGGALALSGADFGLSGHSGSASFAQYRLPETPPISTPPVSVPPVPTSPVPTPQVPLPPASQSPPTLAAAVLSTRGVATISCAAACHIVLRAQHGSHRVHATFKLDAKGTTTVHLSKGALRRLGPGRVVLSIEVDGKVVATRTVKVA